MNKYFLELETQLPNECIEDIKRLKVEYRNEKWSDELYKRYLYRYEKKLRDMSDKEFWKFAFNDQEWKEEVDEPGYNLYYKKIKTIKRLKELREREEMIQYLLEDFQGSETEYIDYIVDVYMDD